MKKLKSLSILLILVPISLLASENRFEGMTEEQKKSTGVHKLSVKEQIALSQWLKSSKEEIIKEDKRKFMGFKREEAEREEIHSNIDGEFNGWQGKTLFKLENGQIWKQTERTTFYIPKKNRAKITIKPKSMGSWVLYVDGYGRGVKVKRIK